MKISTERHSQIVQFFLILIASTLIFRVPCTWFIIAFSLYCLYSIKKITLTKEIGINIFIISIPLVLEIIFFWNNQNFLSGIKSLEKSTALFVLPLFIIGNYKYINFNKLIKQYSIITTLIMVFLMIRYYFVYNQFFLSFYYGMNMWNMGYHFANSLGMHAPALNMHMAFVSTIMLYLTLNKIRFKRKILIIFILVSLFVITFGFLLIINTRVSLVSAIIGYLIVIFYQFKNLTVSVNTLKISTYIVIIASVISIIFLVFVKNNHFMEEKYNRLLFDKLDKIGKLDEIQQPESVIYSSLVTRITIWKTTIELAKNNIWIGFGSADSKQELFNYYAFTNQKFLAKHKLPVHNQYLDFLLKFGILGLIGALLYVANIAYWASKLNNALALSFFVIFFLSNITDDFLIRFDGIVFSGFWISTFAAKFHKENKLI